jgi:hypothetical protein
MRTSAAAVLGLVLGTLTLSCDSTDKDPVSALNTIAFSASRASEGTKPVEQFHDHTTGSFSEEFCGIHADVDFVLTNNFFLYANGSFKTTTSGRFTYTNPANGKSVVFSFAGVRPSGSAPIVDEEAGTITFVVSFKGLPAKLQTANGPVLLRDAGIITLADTFDSSTGEFISSEILVDKGPHPHADSDFTLFCELFASALT